MRTKSIRAFLWSSVILWGIALGAKLFDLLVLAGAWGADVPSSLAFYPYGKNWPIDPGNFFQPLSALLLIAIAGALAAGWKTEPRFKRWLWLSVLAFVLIWMVTPTVFWPLINAIYRVAHHRVSLSDAEAVALIRRWYLYDSARIVVIAIGFVSSLRAFSLPVPASRTAKG